MGNIERRIGIKINQKVFEQSNRAIRSSDLWLLAYKQLEFWLYDVSDIYYVWSWCKMELRTVGNSLG